MCALSDPARPPETPRLSVVIPTLNEAGALGALLAALKADAPDAEIIVVDGGSADGTAALARRAGVRLLETPPGRGAQLQAGARAASGAAILFLHADAGWPQGGGGAIEAALRDPQVVGGNFRVVFDGGTRFAEWLTGFYAWFRRHGLFYGDSGIFARRSVLEAMGGVRPLVLMEDYDLRHRLRRQGQIVCIDAPALGASSRRFDGRHPVAIVWGWVLIHLLYFCRVPGPLLARVYDSRRRRPAGRRGRAAMS